jgi:hypothetical protein
VGRKTTEYEEELSEGFRPSWKGTAFSRAASRVQHEALAAGVRFSLRPGDEADAGGALGERYTYFSITIGKYASCPPRHELI